MSETVQTKIFGGEGGGNAPPNGVKRRRRENRGAEGAECMGWGMEGVSPYQPTRGSGELREPPSAFWRILKAIERSFLHLGDMMMI